MKRPRVLRAIAHFLIFEGGYRWLDRCLWILGVADYRSVVVATNAITPESSQLSKREREFVENLANGSSTNEAAGG